MERITLLSIAIFLFASITKAQITKGSVYLGGIVGASQVNQEVANSSVKGKRSSVYINPAVGIAVKNNLVAGIDFIYSNSKSKNYYGYQDYKNGSHGAGFFLRQYFPLVKHLYLFGEGNLEYSQNKYEGFATPSTAYLSKTTQKFVSASLYPGLAFNVYKSFYLETSFPSLLNISYNESTSETNPNWGSGVKTKDKGFAFESDLINTIYLNLGIRFIIPKK